MKYSEAYIKARELAAKGEDCGDLICKMLPNETMMLQIYVRNLKPDIAKKNIYGRAVHAEMERDASRSKKTQSKKKKHYPRAQSSDDWED
jgi:hypothetical protein